MKDRTTKASCHVRQPYVPLEARSFAQVANAPIKGTYKGAVQGQTSYVPYRSSKPPIPADVLPPDRQQVRTRRPVTTEDLPNQQSIIQQYGWLRYPLVAFIIMYSLYALYTGWIIPKATAISDQWHYGDARVSHTTMTINGKVRDLLGIGYKGQVEVIILPDFKDPTSKASFYIAPQPFHDTTSRYVILHPAYVNAGDHMEDIVVEIEDTGGVSPVLYGKADGTFQWTVPA
jgi:hypothetical protein